MSKHKLTHPESKQTVETTDEYVEMYESQGWVEAGKKPATTEATTPQD